MYTQQAWSLKDLFPDHDSPKLAEAFSAVDQQVAVFESFRGGLKPDLEGGAFLKMLDASESMARWLGKLSGFARLSFAADTQDQAAQAWLARTEQFGANVQNRMLFFTLWWKGLDDENAHRLMRAAGDYRYYLEQLRLFKPHTLSEAEEKVVNLKNITGVSALQQLYDSITNRYVFRLNVRGEIKELTRGELMPYVQGPDPELRAHAYQELYRVYAADGPILGQIYQAIVRDWHNENVSVRSFASPIAARNLENDIPDEAVEVLLGVAERNAGIFRRYFTLKARHLGVAKLRRYDVYAPVAKSERKFDFEAAARLTLDTFASFDPGLADMAERVFGQNHLDAEIRKGKESGAFCASVLPDMTPYVLLNYQGRVGDVLTMAHELGHAVHSMCAHAHTAFTFSPALPLAETASTFAEMLMTDHLLETESDETVRREILFKQMDGSWATILRQAYFSIFEKQAHEMIHGDATVDELSAAYLDNLRSQFGDSVDLSEDFKWEWVSIPHFFAVPFYVYAYAFGQLLVFSLYRQFKAESEAFKPKYLKILSAGGSEAPARILAEAGIDIRSEQFWQGGFDIVNELVTDLEALKL